MRRWFVSLAGAALLTLGSLTLAPSPTLAQEGEAPATEEGEGGNMYYGYVGTAFIGGLIVFAVCKTARR